ncbi:MAG: LysR family transcriptional regulator [Methylobacillus sp.]|jgi:DNA-binding transcriptional LysR family regulator|nr:LysR family transcriptional regulator [Methylobacillus sp.]
MDRLQAMRVFTAVVDNGSFARAAEQLRLSPTATSRHVADLEKHLGAQLLQRSTRRINLTEIGVNYYDRCCAILADVEEAEALAVTSESQPRGISRVSLPTTFGMLYIAPAIPEFCRRYPDLQLELSFNDRIVDLVEEGMDMAVRITSEPKTSLIARKLAEVSLVCCASPAYLKQYGTPQHPEDLRNHNCLTYSYSPTASIWKFQRDGREYHVPVKGRIVTNNGDMSRIAITHNLGVDLLPSFLVCKELRAGKLHPILQDYATPPLGVYAVYLSGARRAARVKAMVEYLWEVLGQGNPPWKMHD